MGKGFYSSSHNIRPDSKDQLGRAIKDINAGRDLMAEDYQTERYVFASSATSYYNTVEDFNLDGDWHAFSLADQMPNSNPKRVLIWVGLRSTSANRIFRVFPCLNNRIVTPGSNHFRFRTFIADMFADGNFILPIDKYKKILYSVNPSSTINWLGIMVLGWWE
jgi:hypothetical protein